MENYVERESWASFLKAYSKRNELRPTWIQVFGETGAQSEESGLPLAGISMEEKGADAPTVQIMLAGRDTMNREHLTHVITNVDRISPQSGPDGIDDAIEFVNKQAEATLLIFKHRAKIATDIP